MLFIEHDAWFVITRTRDNARDALIIGLVTLMQCTFFANDHDGSWFDEICLSYVEIFGTVGVREDNVFANTNLTTDPDIAVEKARVSLTSFLLCKNGGSRAVRIEIVGGYCRRCGGLCFGMNGFIASAISR